MRLSNTSSYRLAYAKALVDLGERLEDLVVLDADTSKSTMTIRFSEKFGERYFNVGISEQDLIGIAAGLAVGGLRPVASAFAAFMMRGWEQIRSTIDRDGLNVKLVATHSGLSPHVDGSSHQSLEDVSLMRSLGRTSVFVPADAVSTYEVVVWSVEKHRGPAYIRLGRDNARPVYGEGEFEFRPGGLSILRDGRDSVIFAMGPMVGVALEAAKLLKEESLDVGVVDVYSIKPLGRSEVLRIASGYDITFTLEDHRVVGGLGSSIAEVLAESGGGVRLVRMGVDGGRYGSSARSFEELLAFMGLDPASIAKRVRGVLS